MKGNHYHTLGIRPDASQEAVQTAYRRRAMAAHPDRTGSGPSDFQDVQEAYRVLGDPARRREYDRGLQRDHGTPARSTRPPASQPPVEPFAQSAEAFAERFAGAPEGFTDFDELFERLWRAALGPR